ncbi:transposable element Tcb2 transposase [Trichonephila clavipes]|nr:transposable element Tcb2 transposase [Trichonephila clavipes]
MPLALSNSCSVHHLSSSMNCSMKARAKSVRTLASHPKRCSSLVDTRPCGNFPTHRANVSGTPATSISGENIEKVRKLIIRDRSLTVCMKGDEIQDYTSTGLAANEACPLSRMNGDHLPHYTGHAEYLADDMVSRYWENYHTLLEEEYANYRKPPDSADNTSQWREYGGNGVDVTAQVAFEIQRRMRTSLWQLQPKETDGAQHQICLVSSFQLPVPPVSRQTVYRRLGHIGLYARRPSRFSLQSDSRRTLIWRAPGTRHHQDNTIERHRYGGVGWLVWGGIILGSRTDLHAQSVTMTGHIYRDVILEQLVRLFRGAMDAEFLIMDDNARPYHANIVDEFLQSEDITRMDWPAYSPDLNPIEHVCDMLVRRIAARQPLPTCLPELRRAVLD